jgi:hypothetical protein
VKDYYYPSIYFAYFVFFILAAGAAYFLAKTWKHGYFGRNSEEAKYRMLEDKD